MSVTKSFFDITTGRNHGVIPTSDAVRIVLDSGATLMLDKVPPCNCRPPDGCSDCNGPKVIRARAAWGERAIDPPGDLLHRAFSCVMPATRDRIDRALSALVERLLIGESGVEVTEWTFREGCPSRPDGGAAIPFGSFVSVPLFNIDGVLNDGESKDDAITRLLLSAVETARNDDRGGLIHAVVIRSTDGKMAGIACIREKPEPPVGATRVARRRVGGKPYVDLPFEQVESKRFALVERMFALLKADCAMVGLDCGQVCPRLSLLRGDGREAVGPELPWSAETDHDMLADAVAALTAKGSRMKAVGASTAECSRRPVTLRLTAVRRAT